MSSDCETKDQARAIFPNGLVQPGGYRFGTDSLLLASFASPVQAGTRLLDLGCGCGIVSVAVMLDAPKITAVALDREAAFVHAAEVNSKRLGLALQPLVLDLESEDLSALAQRSADLVLMNPPFFSEERGRVPTDPLRRSARFARPDTLTAFCRAGSRAMADKARLDVIYPASGLAALFRSLDAASLHPARILAVHARRQEPAFRVLVEAVKTRADLEIMPPLILNQGTGSRTRLTGQARQFCRFL